MRFRSTVAVGGVDGGLEGGGIERGAVALGSEVSDIVDACAEIAGGGRLGDRAGLTQDACGSSCDERFGGDAFKLLAAGETWKRACGEDVFRGHGNRPFSIDYPV